MQGTADAAADLGEVPEQYVINLCASTTPMALEQPKSEALKRFTFFVSRRREDGRERFRLHMGYFTNPAEAEEWLAIVRELYPAAWVGEAPGKKLRAAARAAAASRTPAASKPVASPALIDALVAPKPVARAPVPATVPAPVRAPAPAPAIASPTARAPITPIMPIVPALPRHAAPPVPILAAPPPVVAPVPVSPAAPSVPAAVSALSNVREVLAQLDSTDSTPAHTLYVPPPPVLPEHIPTVQALTPAPMKPAPAIPVVVKAPVAPKPVASKPVASKPVAPKPVATPPVIARALVPVVAPVSKVAPAAAPAPLSDTQVLRVLEDRRAQGASTAAEPTPTERAADSAIEMLRPEDTRTMRALKEEVQQNAPMHFAVQLDWSVTAIDVSKVPPLAIFGAYTLYTVESNRDGRRWYGLRLGFFSDALSAKQVAYYVRSDFATVAVVPVTTVEKENAVAGAHRQSLVAPKRALAKPTEEFKLFDADQPPAKPAPPAEAVRAKLADAAKAGKRAGAASGGGRAKAAPRKKARSLEESLEQTLEILGAGDLEIDKGRGELLNDSGVRHLSIKVDKRTSTFSKLLDRLSDRVGKS